MITSQTYKVYLSDIYTGYNVIDSVFGVMSIIGITYITRDNEGIHNCHSGQKKNMCAYCQIVVPESDSSISFSKFSVK